MPAPEPTSVAPPPAPVDFREPGLAADAPEVLFGGSPFMRWTLAPVATLAGVGLLVGMHHATLVQAAWRAGASSCLLLFALALWFPRRCGFAARIVTGLVFVACCSYVVDRAWHEVVPAPGSRGESSLPDAIQALVMFGIPSLWFTLRGGARSRRGAGPAGRA
jgi:hypothetical protein